MTSRMSGRITKRRKPAAGKSILIIRRLSTTIFQRQIRVRYVVVPHQPVMSGGRAAFGKTLHGYIHRDLRRITVRTPKRGMRGNLAVGRPSRTAISDIYEDGLIVMIWSVVCLRTGHQGLFTARIRVIPEPRRPDISLQPSIICRPFSDGLLICENCSSRHDEYSGQNILTRRARESAALAFRRIKGDLLCV